MPTGYTICIKDGVSFETFALRCARNFGALIEMRDEDFDAPIPKEFKPTPYHQEEIKKAEEVIKKLEKITAKEADIAALKKYTDKLQERKKELTKNKLIIKRYQSMLEEAGAWTPPTEEHQGLKTFMINQLRESIEFDGLENYYKKHPVIEEKGHQWREEGLLKAEKDIEYHTIEDLKEIERCAGRTRWVKELLSSLK